MEKVKLGDICTIQSGGTPSRSNKTFWENGTIPWVKISDFNGKYLYKTSEKITEEGLKNSSAKFFNKGTILYTIFATLGETCILDIDATTNQAIAGLNLKNQNILPEYLYYFLASQKSNIINIGRGVAQNNINLKILKNLPINIISLEKQKQIVFILNKVNSLIDLRKNQIEKLDLLVKSQFIEMFGDFMSEKTRWPICNVGDVADTIDPHPSHRTPPVCDDGVPYIGIAECDYTTNTIKFENARTVSVSVLEDHKKRYKISDGDFIIGKIGTIGKPIFIPSKQDYTLSANTVLIQPQKEKVNPVFLIEFFKSAYMDDIIDREKKSTSQPAFGIQKVRKIQMPNPPMDLQNKFAAVIKQADKSKFEIQKSLEKLETLKKALMQEYFK